MGHRRMMISLGLLIVLAGSLGGAAATQRAMAATRSSASALCHTAQLTITPDGGGAGVGHVGVMFSVHNSSAQACDLVGYPGVQMLDATDRPLPTHVTWGPGYLAGSNPVQRVHLNPGANAYFSVEWVHIPSTGQTCSTAQFLQIIPPNETVALLVPDQLNAVCGGKLTVSPIVSAPLGGFAAMPVSPPPASTFVFGREGGNIRPFSVTISATGAITATGAAHVTQTRLSADALDGLRTLVKAEGFQTMPALITGTHMMPDIAAEYITITSGTSTKEVRLQSGNNAAFAQLYAVLMAVAGVAF